jgi:hypothetical protein
MARTLIQVIKESAVLGGFVIAEGTLKTAGLMKVITSRIAQPPATATSSSQMVIVQGSHSLSQRLRVVPRLAPHSPQCLAPQPQQELQPTFSH